MKINLKNSETSLRFLFQNESFRSSGYEIFRNESGDYDDEDDSSLITTFAKTENLGLVVRFYDEGDLKYSETDSQVVKRLPYSDVIVNFRNSNNLKSLEVTEEGIAAHLNGIFVVDLSIEVIKEFYGHHVAYVLGFCGGNQYCHFLSFIEGYVENQPNTWKVFTSSNHLITLRSNLQSKFFLDGIEKN
jgi:hypothetical protein